MANIQNEAGAPPPEGSVPLSVPVLGGNEWTYVKECLDTNWISSAGPFVEKFERIVAERLGVRHAVATVNGTSALHLALHIAGVGTGDEVVIPALTFIATANAVRYTGAVPAILDVEANYWQLDTDRLAEFLQEECGVFDGVLRNRTSGRRVAAIMPVHVLGHPCDMDKILHLAEQYGLPIIEDAAEGLGTLYKGRAVGTFGLMAALSFNGNKIISCGGGGMLVTDNDVLAKRARYFSTQAKDDDRAYIHKAVGFNYRLTNIQAAIGVAQMEQLDHHLDAKRQIAAVYLDGLRDIPGLSFMKEADWAKNTWWLSTILVDPDRFGMNNMDLLRQLQKDNIQSRPLWQPMHQSPSQKGAYVHRIEQADRIHVQALSLPSSVDMDRVSQQRVIDCIRSSAKSF